jgi:hypothetical protein
MKTMVFLAVIVLTSFTNPGMADEIKGIVTLQSSACPLANLVVEVDPAISSPQPKVVTTTDQDGSFIARVIGGQYLLVIYQQGTKVYQSELQVNQTTYKSITLAPSSTSGMTPCGRPNTSTGQLIMKGVEVRHNGSPFYSTSWHFEVFVNDLEVTGVPEHKFASGEKWRPITDWPPLSAPASGKLAIRIKGYQGGRKHAEGFIEKTVGQGGASEQVDVPVSCEHKLNGDFTFRFLVDKLPPSQS